MEAGQNTYRPTASSSFVCQTNQLFPAEMIRYVQFYKDMSLS